MDDLGVDEMRQERGASQAHGLVVPAEALAELYDQAAGQQIADLGQLCVDNGDHGAVDRGEGQTGGLSLHDSAAEEATATYEILAEELRNDHLDIGRIGLVDEALDRLLQRLPRHALKLGRCLVGDMLLHLAQARRRNVGAARPRLGVVDGWLAAPTEGVLKQLQARIVGREVGRGGLGRRAAGRVAVMGAITLALAASIAVAVSATPLGRAVSGRVVWRALPLARLARALRIGRGLGRRQANSRRNLHRSGTAGDVVVDGRETRRRQSLARSARGGRAVVSPTPSPSLGLGTDRHHGEAADKQQRCSVSSCIARAQLRSPSSPWYVSRVVDG